MRESNKLSDNFLCIDTLTTIVSECKTVYRTVHQILFCEPCKIRHSLKKTAEGDRKFRVSFYILDLFKPFIYFKSNTMLCLDLS